MKPEDIRDKKIENYIHNRMTLIERHEFESELNFNPQLKKEVEELKELVDLYDAKLFALKQRLTETETDLEQNDFFNDSQNG